MVILTREFTFFSVETTETTSTMSTLLDERINSNRGWVRDFFLKPRDILLYGLGFTVLQSTFIGLNFYQDYQIFAKIGCVL